MNYLISTVVHQISKMHRMMTSLLIAVQWFSVNITNVE
jgi:hypothetical protein